MAANLAVLVAALCMARPQYRGATGLCRWRKRVKCGLRTCSNLASLIVSPSSVLAWHLRLLCEQRWGLGRWASVGVTVALRCRRLHNSSGRLHASSSQQKHVPNSRARACRRQSDRVGMRSEAAWVESSSGSGCKLAVSRILGCSQQGVHRPTKYTVHKPKLTTKTGGEFLWGLTMFTSARSRGVLLGKRFGVGVRSLIAWQAAAPLPIE